ncbi:MAG: sulfite oxidase-like oxidoreductase [Proteobacteria bacterium]|nr:sulfite oxidase-like oxidoreductase [Pseudomonadota bacterium]
MAEEGGGPRVRDKLVRAKERWAREGRLLTGEAASPATRRLPPGQRLVKDWPELDLGERPAVDLKDWYLTVGGLVERPLRLDWAAFQRLPQVETVSDIHCVTAWSRYDNRWGGVRPADLLALARPRPEARFVRLRSFDAYTTNLTLEQFTAPGVLLAHSWEGRSLSREHGGPVRAVVPRLYFWKSAKWLRDVVLADRNHPGFWEVRGYHNNGDPWREERYG